MSMFAIWAIVLLIVFLSVTVKVLRRHTTGVVFRFGRFFKVKGPALVIILPIVDRVVIVNLDKEIPEWQTLPKLALDEKVKGLVLNKP